jgi:hypothetical protein
MFAQIYDNLIAMAKTRSGLVECHSHHIIPKHAGGSNDSDNLVELTIREHILAHYCLWKIHRMVNDLRAMHMLGAKLSREYRQTIGKYCHTNRLGFFAEKYVTKRPDWSRAGVATQIAKGIGIHNPANFVKHASLGGKASMQSPKSAFAYWASAEGRTRRAKLGGQAHLSKKAMHIPGAATFIRVKPEDIQHYLSLGYVMGSPVKPNAGRRMESKRKRIVTDGIRQYESVKAAAEAYNVTSAAICCRLKSDLHLNWTYVT